MMKVHRNRLAEEISPYLLHHADNPVDWYPWGEEAIERARKEDKPILLSIGYSACHWCHVMEEECFENNGIARLMNELFINIKVDREERPDLDRLYMSAVQILSGSGGWPLTVFLTPELVPFYGGTYFPSEDRGGMPGFPKVLRSVATAYQTRKDDIANSAGHIVGALRNLTAASQDGTAPSKELIDKACSSLSQKYDWRNGGFGSAPKFPQASSLDFLLRLSATQGLEKPLEMVEKALDGMAAGGIRDHLGGGVHRYSVDERWLVPHFEKMLYDNAMLARIYLDTYVATGKKEYADVARETLEYVLREMTSPAGGFYSSQDADSEGEEGTFYVWGRKEIIALLGERDGSVVARFYGVDEVGNFEGSRSVLHRPVSVETVARLFKTEVEAARTIIERGRSLLAQEREKRERPFRDDKIISAWNGLMIGAMARGYAVLGDRRFLEAARKAADFLLKGPGSEGGLPHVKPGGKRRAPGFLEDYAHVVGGLLDLWEADFDVRWLREAERLAGELLHLFWDEKNGRFSSTGPRHEKLIADVPGIQDDPLPSGNSAAVHVLLRLAALTGESRFEEKAEEVLRSLAGQMEQYEGAVSNLLSGLHRYLEPSVQIVIVGEKDNGETRSHLAAARSVLLPNATIILKTASGAEELEELVPSAREKTTAEGKTTTYVCVDKMCLAPIVDAELLANKLREIQGGTAGS
jgi:uncharacterized protein YyaL (SSP411 family)